MYIPSDISRCSGNHRMTICLTCQRRMQIGFDDPRRFYPFMKTPPALTADYCEFTLPATDEPHGNTASL